MEQRPCFTSTQDMDWARVTSCCDTLLFKKENSSNPLQDRGSAMGKLEPISPVSPVHMDPDLDLVPARFSKEELIQNMDRVDREITMVEQQISKLRKKQVSTPKHLLKTEFAWREIQLCCSLRHPHTHITLLHITHQHVSLFCSLSFILYHMFFF